MANMECETMLDFGVLGMRKVEISYHGNFDGDGVEISEVWMYLDNRPKGIFDELNPMAEDYVSEVANRHWAENQAEEAACAAEAHSDALRDEQSLEYFNRYVAGDR